MRKQARNTNIIIFSALILAVLTSWYIAQKNISNRKKNPTNTIKRIVSGYTAFTEILIAIGGKDMIVAATKDDARKLKIKSIGSHMKPDIEAIISAHPDLVILSSLRPQLVEVLKNKLANSNTRIIAEHPHTIEQTFSFIKKLGTLINKSKEAELIVKQAELSLADIDKIVATIPEEKRPVVFLEVRNSPSLLTCGKDSIAYDIIKRAGGIPAYSIPGTVIHTDVESLIISNPSLYIQQYGAMNRNPIPPSHHQVIKTLECVKKGRILKISEKIMSRPGTHVAEAVIKIHKELYNDN